MRAERSTSDARAFAFRHEIAPADDGSRPSIMFSATVSSGQTCASWKTTPTPLCSRARVSSVASSSPPTRTVPSSGEISPARTRIIVVLPEPFSPTRPRTSPAST